MSGAKGFPHWVDFSVFLVNLGERGRCWYFFSPHHFSFFFSLLDVGATGPGLETGMIPEQETVTVFLTSVSEFLRA